MRKPLVLQVELDVDALRRELRALDAEVGGDGEAAARAAELEERLAERERELEELRLRTSALEEREARLSEREHDAVALAQRAAELDQREAELAHRERDVVELRRNVSERALGAERRDAAGDERGGSTALEHERLQLEEELEVRRARLEAEIELRWDDIDRREEDLDQREQHVVRKEQELVAYVSQVQDELMRREQRWWEHADAASA